MKLFDPKIEYDHADIRDALDTGYMTTMGNYLIKVKGRKALRGIWTSSIWIPNIYNKQYIRYVSDDEIEFSPSPRRNYKAVYEILYTAEIGGQPMNFIHRTEDKGFYFIGELKWFELISDGKDGQPVIFKVKLKNKIDPDVKKQMEQANSKLKINPFTE